MDYHAGSIIDEYSKRAALENESESERSLRVEIPREFIAQYLNSDDVILDAGGGAGINAIHMARRCRSVFLMDITPALLAFAQENSKALKNIHLVRGNVTDLMFPCCAFDLVVCLGDPISYVLEKRFQAFDELVRVTRKNGLLFIGCNSKYGHIQKNLSENNLKAALEIYRNSKTTCVMGPATHLYTVAEMEAILKARNCRILKTASTSSFTLHRFRANPSDWDALKEMELKSYGQPEWLGGLHLFFLAQKMEV